MYKSKVEKIFNFHAVTLRDSVSVDVIDVYAARKSTKWNIYIYKRYAHTLDGVD